MQYEYIRTPEALEAALATTQPTIIVYHDESASAMRLLATVRSLMEHPAMEGVKVLRVGVNVVGATYLRQRALLRLPALAYHNGVREYERLTGQSQVESILAALGRLKAYQRQCSEQSNAA